MKDVIFLTAISVIIFLMNCMVVHSQNVAINTTGAVANGSAILDISSTNTGLLIPRVALTATNVTTPITTPATSLLVYNTAISGIYPNNVTPGYYYWNGLEWVGITINPSGGSYWSTIGNAGTVDGQNFIGSTDNIPLTIRVNNQKAGRIDHLLRNSFWGYQSGNSTTGIENTGIGYQALYYNTTGAGNVAMGYYSLYTNTTGFNNISIGSNALFANSTGYQNVAIGFQALANNTGGAENIATGYRALYSNTTGTFNIASGYQALNSNTTGYHNVAIGADALNLNTTGNYNIAIGILAMANTSTGVQNTAVGGTALYSNTIGYYNTAFGMRSLYSNTTGDRNVANGIEALYSNTTGMYNVAIGPHALYTNTTGYANIGLGLYALYFNTTGSINTAIGSNSLYNNTTGNDNTAIGPTALFNNTTGNFNVGCGEQALIGNIAGGWNTAIGFSAFNAGTNFSNSSAVGYNTVISASNQVRIGNTAVTSIGGQVSWTTISDKRVKENVKNNVPGLEFVTQLRPVTYSYNTKAQHDILGMTDSSSYKEKSEIKEIVFSGFLAQEVDSVANSIGYNFSGVDKSGSLWGIRYSDFVVPLVKAVQEQQKLIDEQKEKIYLQQLKIEEFEKRLRIIEEKHYE